MKNRAIKFLAIFVFICVLFSCNHDNPDTGAESESFLRAGFGRPVNEGVLFNSGFYGNWVFTGDKMYAYLFKNNEYGLYEVPLDTPFGEVGTEDNPWFITDNPKLILSEICANTLNYWNGYIYCGIEDSNGCHIIRIDSKTYKYDILYTLKYNIRDMRIRNGDIYFFDAHPLYPDFILWRLKIGESEPEPYLNCKDFDNSSFFSYILSTDYIFVWNTKWKDYYYEYKLYRVDKDKNIVCISNAQNGYIVGEEIYFLEETTIKKMDFEGENIQIVIEFDWYGDYCVCDKYIFTVKAVDNDRSEMFIYTHDGGLAGKIHIRQHNNIVGIYPFDNFFIVCFEDNSWRSTSFKAYQY